MRFGCITSSWGRPTDDAVWNDRGVEGTSRFLDRVWRLATEPSELEERPETEADTEILRAAHRTLRKVSTDIDRFTFNTAVAALMELSNTLAAYRRDGARAGTWGQAMDLLALMLAPMAPHLAHELWDQAGHDTLLAEEAWPEWDPDLVVEQTVTMVVQVNGKVRDRIEVPADISEEDATALALASERVAKYLDGAEPNRVVVRPPHLVNVVV